MHGQFGRSGGLRDYRNLVLAGHRRTELRNEYRDINLRLAEPAGD